MPFVSSSATQIYITELKEDLYTRCRLAIAEPSALIGKHKQYLYFDCMLIGAQKSAETRPQAVQK
jgi:hypothetical protein